MPENWKWLLWVLKLVLVETFWVLWSPMAGSRREPWGGEMALTRCFSVCCPDKWFVNIAACALVHGRTSSMYEQCSSFCGQHVPVKVLQLWSVFFFLGATSQRVQNSTCHSWHLWGHSNFYWMKSLKSCKFVFETCLKEKDALSLTQDLKSYSKMSLVWVTEDTVGFGNLGRRWNDKINMIETPSDCWARGACRWLRPSETEEKAWDVLPTSKCLSTSRMENPRTFGQQL